MSIYNKANCPLYLGFDNFEMADQLPRTGHYWEGPPPITFNHGHSASPNPPLQNFIAHSPPFAPQNYTIPGRSDITLDRILTRARQLHRENQALRVMISTTHKQQRDERKAFSDFADEAVSIDLLLPVAVKTPQYQRVYQNMIQHADQYIIVTSNAGQIWDEAQSRGQSRTQQTLPEIRQMPTPDSHVSTPPHQHSITSAPEMFPDMSPDRTPYIHTANPPHFSDVVYRQAEVRTHLTSIIQELKRAHATLQASVPTTNTTSQATPQARTLQSTLDMLHNNATTFPDFLLAYLNGRTSNTSTSRLIRPNIKAILEPFFEEPRDAQWLVTQIMAAVKDAFMVKRGDLEGPAGDVVGPVVVVLEMLLAELEGVERGM